MASAREIAQELFDQSPDVAMLERALHEYAAGVLEELASQADTASEYANHSSAKATWWEVRDDLRRRAEEERRG